MPLNIDKMVALFEKIPIVFLYLRPMGTVNFVLATDGTVNFILATDGQSLSPFF